MENFKKDKQFKRILIANRGEIAIRVARAAAEIGLSTISIYTDEDKFSQHRYKTDEAYMVGLPDEPLKAYLDIEGIIQLAKREAVDMIHPGYGFLSENIEFARKCELAGITFVGPDHKIMAALGDKVSAKKIAQKVNVPVIEGIEIGEKISDKLLTKIADIGFPLMIKAIGGGGGRGMRLVHNAEKLADLIDEAKKEAQRAFGNGGLFIEKFIESPKHIEVQILGDKHGNIFHLYERDCSVQRRFQKIIEVAPCISLSAKSKEQIYDYALRIAKEVNYFNAGTVEFLVDKNDQIFFIEVNPRIQVEHTITEEITGIDIVRSQLLIAMGHKLSGSMINLKSQSQIKIKGVAIQCRVTTENPSKDFTPDYGVITAYRTPGGHGIRLDESGVYPGIRISPFFDSLLVKVTSFGRSIESAGLRMSRALREIRIRGVNTNIGFLSNVLQNHAFRAGEARVNFISEHPKLLKIQSLPDSSTKVLAFLGNVMVNGNPDIKHFDKGHGFSHHNVPVYNEFAKPPAGSRDLFNEKGRDEFCRWLKRDNKIHYTDTTLRDAHQSLLATRLRTIDMVKIAGAFSHNVPQIFSMEVWGGATFDASMRFLKEDPWLRLKLLRKKIPNILFQMLFRGANGVGYSAYPDNLIEAFIEKAAEYGIDIFRVFDSLNWLPSMENSINAIIKNTDKILEASICYTGDILDKSRPKYNLNYYLDMSKRLEDMGIHILGIKDMAGLLTPYAAELLICELKKTVDIPIHLHTHDTSGIQSATYLKAIEAGVDVIDVAVSSMSGLTSQPNFNSLVNCMKGQPRENPINLDHLNDIADYFDGVREYYYPFESELKAGTAEVYKNEIPGGQYSNLKPQARALGLEKEFSKIKKNYAITNHLFGDIVKVTPSSKVVGDFAIFMTSNDLTSENIFDKASSLSFPESVISFFKGDLGQPPGGFPKKLQKLILKDVEAYQELPNEHLNQLNITEEFVLFQEKFDDKQRFVDFLSYMLYPKVFEEFYEHQKTYGDVYKIPTPNFFYGIEHQELITVELSKGKEINIGYVHTSKVDENGCRALIFKLNGISQTVTVKDLSVEVVFKKNQKVDPTNYHQVGAPLQGKLIEFFVKQNDKVKLNQPLFSIEAMKMETTVTSPKTGKVTNLHLSAGILVESDDLVVTLD
ncbi:MAG: pyruvate carboxylase [SAR324 cluster bacterium]|nr:pyruvate carboxylase [SAR324 cluster bacterium]